MEKTLLITREVVVLCRRSSIADFFGSVPLSQDRIQGTFLDVVLSVRSRSSSTTMLQIFFARLKMTDFVIFQDAIWYVLSKL